MNDLLKEVAILIAAAGGGVSSVMSIKLWYKLGGYDATLKDFGRRLNNLEKKVFQHG